jgi:hypothetical protein
MSPSNPNGQPAVFAPNSKRKICMVDDNRSVYDMCKLTTDEQNVNINPQNDHEGGIALENTYNQFFDKFPGSHANPNFYLNTDSGSILQTLADPQTYNSAIAYNGDMLYAAIGAGIYPENT